MGLEQSIAAIRELRAMGAVSVELFPLAQGVNMRVTFDVVAPSSPVTHPRQDPPPDAVEEDADDVLFHSSG